MKLTVDQRRARQRAYSKKWRAINRSHWLSEHRRQQLEVSKRKKLGLPKPKPRLTRRPGLITGELREKVLASNGYACAICGITNTDHFEKVGREISIHHKDGNGLPSRTPNNSLENLEPLCNACHRKEHIKRR